MDVLLVLQGPRHPPQLAGGADSARGEEDDVGVELVDEVTEVVGRAEYGEAVAGLDDPGVVGRDEAADDVVAEPALPVQHSGDLADVAGRPDGQHPLGEAAVFAGLLDQAPDEGAAQHEQDDADGEQEHEEATRERGLEQVGAHADHGSRGERGVDDEAELVGSGAEVVPVVGAGEGQQAQPGDDEERAQRDGVVEDVATAGGPPGQRLAEAGCQGGGSDDEQQVDQHDQPRQADVEHAVAGHDAASATSSCNRWMKRASLNSSARALTAAASHSWVSARSRAPAMAAAVGWSK